MKDGAVMKNAIDGFLFIVLVQVKFVLDFKK